MNVPSSFAELETRSLAKAAPSITTRMIDTKGPVRRIHALEGGRGAPLLLLHGGGGLAAAWTPVLEGLAARYHVLAIDRPGCGLSDRVDYRRVADYGQHTVDVLASVLDAVEWPRASILANSMGAFGAVNLALAHPERVDKLVLAGAPAGADRSLPFALRLLGVRGVNGLLQSTVESPKGIRGMFGRVLVAHPERVPDDLYELALLSSTLPGARRAWLSMLETFTTLRGVTDRCYVRDSMVGLRQPTLFVWGERDAFAPPSSGADLARRIPQAKLVTIPDSGHLPWLDAPDAVLAATASWLG